MLEDQYQSNGILTPSNLEMGRVAAIFGIDIIYHAHGTFSDNEEKVIFLNQYEDLKAQRMIFFHELCHVIRHSGVQMPAIFRGA